MTDKQFLEAFERKLRKAVKLNPVKKGETILADSKITEFCLGKAVKGLPHKVVRSGRHDKKVVQWTIDDEDRELLYNVFNNKNLKKENEKMIKLFRFVTDEELKKYAKLNKIKVNVKSDEIKKLIADLSKKYPQTRYSLSKSYEEIKKIVN